MCVLSLSVNQAQQMVTVTSNALMITVYPHSAQVTSATSSTRSMWVQNQAALQYTQFATCTRNITNNLFYTPLKKSRKSAYPQIPGFLILFYFTLVPDTIKFFKFKVIHLIRPQPEDKSLHQDTSHKSISYISN